MSFSGTHRTSRLEVAGSDGTSSRLYPKEIHVTHLCMTPMLAGQHAGIPRRLVLTVLLSAMPLLFSAPAPSQAPSLGSAATFAVLAGSTGTSTGATAITGDLGVSPGTAVTGLPPGTMTGTLHAGGAFALKAQGALTTAYNALAGAARTATLTGQDLGGGRILTAGVYGFAA